MPALISGLLRGSCPAAVAGSIVAERVDPVERKPGRPFAHVEKKGGEVLPLVANSHASVVLAGCLARASYALPHGAPTAVGASSISVPRVTMSGVRSRGPFALQAAARSGEAGDKTSCVDLLLGSAITATDPVPSAIPASAESQNAEAGESLSCKVTRRAGRFVCHDDDFTRKSAS